MLVERGRWCWRRVALVWWCNCGVCIYLLGYRGDHCLEDWNSAVQEVAAEEVVAAMTIVGELFDINQLITIMYLFAHHMQEND